MRVHRLLLLFLLSWLSCFSNQGNAAATQALSITSPFDTSTANSATQIVDAVIQKIGPVRNQQDTQLCFGHAVADVATFYSGKRVSSLSVAIRNFQFRQGLDYYLFSPAAAIASQVAPDSRYMLGLASSSLEASLKGTLCADDQPENDLSYGDWDLRQLWEVYENQFRTYIGPKAPVQIFEAMQKQLSQIFPSLSSSDFMKGASRYTPLNQAIAQWFDRACSIRVSPDKLQVVGNETKLLNSNQVVELVSQALEAGSIAVIHYDSGVLRAKDPSLWQSAIGFHVSTIVARADVNGISYFLLRNSWGSDCAMYDEQIAGRCDRGHIWLNENEIRRYVTSVAYLSAIN